MPEQTTPIAETNRFIVLDKYVRAWEAADSYQSEADLERELVQDLRSQGYEYLPDLKSTDAMLANVRVQLQALNDVQFTDKEWARFVETYLDRPSDSVTDQTRKVHDDYIFDFVFDDGRIHALHPSHVPVAAVPAIGPARTASGRLRSRPSPPTMNCAAARPCHTVGRQVRYIRRYPGIPRDDIQ